MYATTATFRPLARPRARRAWPSRARNAVLVGGATCALFLGLAHGAEGGAARYETIVVEPGDTLWSIAGDRYPGTEVRNKVIQIQQANHMVDTGIRPGAAIRVPSR